MFGNNSHEAAAAACQTRDASSYGVNRANTPNDLMAEYYGQRAGAGLIVTEGTSPSPNGTGYPRIPGIWSQAQVAGWRKTTDAVHARGGGIFVQLMHTGRVGIRLSPYGVNAGMKPYPEIEETYTTLVPRLASAGISYVHLVDHSAMGAPPVPQELKTALRRAWPRTFILAGGFNRASAEAALEEEPADLIAFGRPFLANPDLVARIASGLPLNKPDFATFYTPGPKGYIDDPIAS